MPALIKLIQVIVKAFVFHEQHISVDLSLSPVFLHLRPVEYMLFCCRTRLKFYRMTSASDLESCVESL